MSSINNHGQSWRNQNRKVKPVKRQTKSLKSINKKPNLNSLSKPTKKDLKSFIFSFLKNKKFLKYISITFLIFFLGVFVWVSSLSRSLPEPGQLLDREVAESTRIYDRTGENILYEIHGDVKRTFVPIDEIPDHVKQAVIAIEDKDFYEHGGFSLWSIFRAVITRKGGGSTLTQQFTKNTILFEEKNKYIRKIKEWILTPRIESKYTKDEILQMYLNEMPYGSTAYGVEAASQLYFGKSVRDVNVAEAAILAAIIQAPSRYSPYGPNKDILIGRQQYVLDLMYEQGYISEAKKEAGKLMELDFIPPQQNIKAPHFVMYVKDLLSQEYGYSEKTIEQGGLKIYTTLDLYKQEIAEEMITKHSESNETNYNATNASLVSIDPKTGQILAMVGSRDFFDEEIDGQVNITTSLRQPGSSVKPLVYAAAFTLGYTPNTILYDVVTNFSTIGDEEGETYEPHNYDLEEHGPVTIRKALAGSLNIPAVKAIYLAGIDTVLDLAEDLGYNSFEDRDRFGLSLVLGGGEVKLLEHTNAFSAFAREGIINPTSAILKIEDSDGKVLEEFEQKDKKVMDEKVARMINSVLSDNNARAYAFGIDNWLNLGDRPVAAKTGTTNDYRDAWTVGYTPSIVTGVWVGNNDNSEMKRGAAGGVVAAPIWHDYMKKVLGDTPIEYFKELGDINTGKAVIDGKIGGSEKVKIDTATGLLATEYTPESFIEEKRFAQHHSILYYVNPKDPLGDAPKNPGKDPQFELWESRVLAWATEQGFATSSEAAPTEYDNVHIPENFPSISITSPNNNETILDSTLEATVSASSLRGVEKVYYYIDDNLVSSTSLYPFKLVQDVSFLGNGFHNLKARACDDVDNCKTASIEFNLILDQSSQKEDISVTIVEPVNGLAVNNIDFPLPVSVQVNNPTQVAKVLINVFNEEGSQISTINLEPINSLQIEGLWRFLPESGVYKLKPEVYGWLGQYETGNEITITVTDFEQ